MVAGRNKCQHTTCGACFILREPNCTAFACPEPPMKDCLRNFYNCVRDHYFGTNAVSNIIVSVFITSSLHFLVFFWEGGGGGGDWWFAHTQ